jgi:hypothetical protein
MDYSHADFNRYVRWETDRGAFHPVDRGSDLPQRQWDEEFKSGRSICWHG